MSRSATRFVWAVIACGLAGALASLPAVRVDSASIYAAASIATLLAAVFRVSLPPGGGGTSVSAATGGVLFTLVRFGAPAAVPLALASVWAQEYGRRGRRADPLRTLFSMACVVLAALAAGTAHDAARAGFPGVPEVGPLAAAVSTYFLVNSLLVAGAVGLTRGEPPLRYWRSTCLLAAPYYVACAGAGSLAAMALHGPDEAVLITLVGVPVYLAYRGFRSYLSVLDARQQDAEQALARGLRITEALTLAITAQEGASHERVQRLQDLAQRLAQLSGLDTRGQRDVAMAVLLRNIGLLAVPRDTQAKGADAWTPDERAQVQRHPHLSVAMLASAELPRDVREAIETHHERWNGTGYPGQLSGRDIPLAGRIVGLLDVYDELAYPRANGEMRPLAEVLSCLRSEAGRAVDPVLAGALVDLLEGAAAVPSTAEPHATAPADDLLLRGRDVALAQIARERCERELVYDLAEILGSGLRLPDAWPLAARRLAGIVPFSYGGATIAIPRTDVVHLAAAVDPARTEPEAGGERGGLPPEREALALSAVPEAGCVQVTARLSADGKDVGTLTLLREGRDPFTAADRRLVERVADLVARKALDAHRLEGLCDARLDASTGLPNGRGLQEIADRELERSRREAVPLSLLYVDVDGMGAINETFGLGTGDRVLRLVAQTLRESVRPYDTCARIGGDEFVLLFPCCAADIAAARARHLADKVSAAALQTTRGPVHVCIDAAAVTYPADGDTLASLLEQANHDLRNAVVAPRTRSLAVVPDARETAFCREGGTVEASEATAGQVRAAAPPA